MTVLQALAWIQAGQTLLTAGVATAQNIRTWIAAQHAGLSEAELNGILETVSAGAARHQALANADAGNP